SVGGRVWGGGDRGGLRVTGSGRGHAADCVEAEHLDNVRQQPGGCADLGGVEVQLGDVARAVVVLGDDLAGDHAAVGCLPLRRASGWLHEGVVNAPGEVCFDVVLGEGERAVRLCGAGVDLAAEHHRLLQRGHAPRGGRVIEQVELCPCRAARECGGAQVGVEATRVGAQGGQQRRVADRDGAGREATCLGGGEQRH